MKLQIRIFLLSVLSFGALFSASALWKNKWEWERKTNREIRKEIKKEDGLKIYKAYKKNSKKHFTVEGYFTYNKQTYFLVSDTIKDYSFSFELLDINGISQIPVEANFIGTPDFALYGCVEVGKAGKVGLFHLDSKAFLPPAFEFIMPDGNGHAYGYANGNWKKLSFENGAFKEKAEKPSVEMMKSCLSYRVIPQNYVSIKSPGSLDFIPNLPGFKSISLSTFQQRLCSHSYFNDLDELAYSNFISISDFNQTYLKDLPPAGSSSHRFISWISEMINGGRGPYESNSLSIVNMDKQGRITTFYAMQDLPKEEVIPTIQQFNDSLITYKQETSFFCRDSIELTINGIHYYPMYVSVPSFNYIVSHSIDSVSLQNWGFYCPNLHIKRLTEADFQDSVKVYFEQEKNGNYKAYNIQFGCLPIVALNYLKADILTKYGYTFPQDSELRKYIMISEGIKQTDQFPKLTEIEAYNLRMIEDRIQFLSKDEQKYTRPNIVEVPFEQ